MDLQIGPLNALEGWVQSIDASCQMRRYAYGGECTDMVYAEAEGWISGHHHPDYQRAASEAVARSRRQKRDRYNETEREQTQSGVGKIADKR